MSWSTVSLLTCWVLCLLQTGLLIMRWNPESLKCGGGTTNYRIFCYLALVPWRPEFGCTASVCVELQHGEPREAAGIHGRITKHIFIIKKTHEREYGFCQVQLYYFNLQVEWSIYQYYFNSNDFGTITSTIAWGVRSS